jgi:trans-AT polyketide synthase/acyltransferase/oxidoreductase domain-containing protein
MGMQDTASAPAGDLFELGARVQVLKKGVSFSVRANRLHDLWRRHGEWEEIDPPTRAKVERECFGRGFERVYEEVISRTSAQEIERAERDGRHKMALVFRWYFDHATRLALSGAPDKANYQVQCTPALGAFNQWVKGTPLEPWSLRHADLIADAILDGAAGVLNRQFQSLGSARA